MTKIEEIRDVVKNYQKTADRWFNDYNTKTAKIRERYKESVAKDEIMMNVWPNIFGNLEAERDRAKEKIEELCEDVKADIKKWTLKPISGNTLELLRAVHDFKIPLTKSELEMIQSDVDGNLLASKIFAGLASDYGYAVAVPNVDGLLQELRELESYAKVSVDAYRATVSEVLKYIHQNNPNQLFAPGMILMEGSNSKMSPELLQKQLRINRELGINSEIYFYNKGIDNPSVRKVLKQTYYQKIKFPEN